MNKLYDVVLYGATGFTGRQTVEYFHAHAPNDLRWAIAVRNPSKLESIARRCAPGRDLDRLVASGDDRAALGEMCSKTRVVLTTAGPFTLYGRALVDACVEHGVHYTDITGETPFVADLIEDHHDTAQGTVPASSFVVDSVPRMCGLSRSTLFFEFGQVLQDVVNGFRSGGLNGGTLRLLCLERIHKAPLRDVSS